jgi:hypothetical protein
MYFINVAYNDKVEFKVKGTYSHVRYHSRNRGEVECVITPWQGKLTPKEYPVPIFTAELGGCGKPRPRYTIPAAGKQSPLL